MHYNETGCVRVHVLKYPLMNHANEVLIFKLAYMKREVH